VLVGAVRKLRRELAEVPISGDEHITAEPGLDSVDRVELLIAVEEALGVEDEVDPRMFMSPPTINDLVNQIMVVGAAA
jgi:acyl carrier protein